MLWGVLFAKLVFNMETIDAATLERILDLLLMAAKQPAQVAPRTRKPVRGRKATTRNQ